MEDVLPTPKVGQLPVLCEKSDVFNVQSLRHDFPRLLVLSTDEHSLL